MEGGGPFRVRLGVGFAMLNVTGGDEMMDVVPQIGGTQTDFGEGARGGSNDGQLTGSSVCEK